MYALELRLSILWPTYIPDVTETYTNILSQLYTPGNAACNLAHSNDNIHAQEDPHTDPVLSLIELRSRTAKACTNITIMNRY